jgi:outer membrane protein TolC
MKRILFLLLLLRSVTFSFAQQNNLAYFVENALVNSPLLKDFQSQLQSLSLDSQLIRAALKTQVNGTGNGLYAPIIKGWGYDEVVTNKQQLTALVQFNKSFFTNKNTASQIAALRLQFLSVTNNSKINEQDLKKTITDQYIITYGEQLQLDFGNQVISMLQKEEAIFKKLTQDNVYKQSDYLSFAVNVQQQELIQAQLKIQYDFDYAGLKYFAGITDTITVPLEDPKLTSELLNDFSTGFYSKQFMLDSLKIRNDKALIDLTYRPRLSVFADAGYNSSFYYKPYKNIGGSVGFNLVVPIYDGRQKKLQYAKIDVQEKLRQDKKNFFMQQQAQQIIQLTQQINSTDKLIDQIARQVKYTETLIAVNEKLLATGDIRLTDFILALNNYFTAKNLLTQNYISRLKILNQLNYRAR